MLALLARAMSGSVLPWAVAGAVALASGYVVWTERALAHRAEEIRRLDSVARDAERRAAANAAAFDRARADHARALAALAIARDRTDARARRGEAIRRSLDDASDLDDGVGDALGRVLERLRGSPSGDGDPRRAPGDPAGAAGLRPEPAGP